jgi:hypothetical protein
MIVYVFFLIILFLLFLIEIRNRETDISTNGTVSVNSITEGFESGNGIYTGTLTALIQVDDQFEVYHKGKHVGSGNGWNRAFEITIPNVAEGDKIVIRCNNGGGPGGIIAKFTYNGKDYFSNKDNIIFTGRYLNDGTLSGSKYVGCFNDRADRDMRGDYGWGFSPEQCARVTARDGYPYYAIQAGSYCFGSHNYGRYGQSDNCNQRCSNQGSEFCGGGWANKIWAKNEQPERIDMGTRSNSIWGGNTDARFGDNARWVWVKHGHRSDDYATGWWECYFKLPTFQKIGYCADPTYQEFNPGACSNPINTERCIATTLNNYTFDASMCKNKLDFYNHDKFYVCMNKVFKMLKKID